MSANIGQDQLDKAIKPVDFSDKSSSGEQEEKETPWADAISVSVVGSSDLDDVNIPPRPLLVGDWWKEGDLGYICAQRGVGKTHLAMMFARAIAGPTPNVGPWDCPGNVQVLYVDGEMPFDDIRNRDKAYLNTDASSSVLYMNHEVVFQRSGREMNIADPEFQSSLLEFCVNREVKVVFFDNLSSLASGMDENGANDWEQVKPWLLRFRRAGISVVIVHHAGRSGKMRGTSKREDDTFWIVELEDEKDEATKGAKFRMRFSKNRNDKGESRSLSWHFQPSNVSGNEAACFPVYRALDPEDDFLELVKNGFNRCKDIADSMGWNAPRVSKLANKMKERERIEIDDGKYRFLK
jgi:hypothetical protein